jgi:hypothetical protein
MKKLLLPVALLMSGATYSQCSDIFFSEYLEGTSNNKAIEIYNPTSSAINLTDYVIYRYNNGSPTATDSLFPQDILAAGDVWVAGNPSAVASILAQSDTLHTITFFNGDDALSIKKISTNTLLDIIGIIGVDPGTNWPVGTGATSEFTLVRMYSIQQGNTNWTTAATEYDVYPQNTDTILGHHYMQSCCTAPTASLISQVDNNCFGDANGSIQINASGTGPLTFSWVNRPETVPVLTGLVAGTYTAVVSGACGTDSLVVTITEPTPLTQMLISSTPTGCSLANGTLSITASGSVSPYTFQWSNGMITSTISNLPSGAYTCTVTCANGCVSVATYTVQTTTSPVVTVSLAMDSLCQVLSGPFALNGESPAGGTWSGNGVSGSTFYPDSVSLGWHAITYTYTDTNGCVGSAVDSVFVDFCSGISVPANTDFVISPNPFTDVVTLQFAGSTDNVVSVYDLQGQLVHRENVMGTVARISLSELPVGVYTIQVINANGIATKKIQKSE